MKGPLFYAKILLFGEYGIIKNSKGLSIPYNHYKGGLRIPQVPNAEQRASHQKLQAFARYLKELDSPLVTFDWDRFNNDLEQKMYFDSSIPQGYGVGSSGALVASIYEQYAMDRITVLENLTPEKLATLKQIFAAMESFFHGQSSGLDPLNSYLSIPILISPSKKIETTGLPSQNPEGKGAVFLLDSGQVGETAPMVALFMENMKQETFSRMMKEQFIHYTDNCIDAFLKGNFKALYQEVKQLSSLVLQNFDPMIPKHFIRLWEKGIETNSYYLKLCGSGGGGYILGFTDDLEKAQKELSGHSLQVVYNF
ncbi:MAG: mevalonate kinase [Flavobacteriaceae bacterium]